MNRLSVFRAHVLATLILPLVANATHVCDPNLDGSTPCPPDSVRKYCPVVQKAACPTGKALAIIPDTEAPPTEYVQVVCDYIGSNRYSCDAWPKFGGISYAWAKSGSLSFFAPPYLDDYAVVTCSPGADNILFLTVTSPYGLSTTTQSAPLYCGYSGEY